MAIGYNKKMKTGKLKRLHDCLIKSGDCVAAAESCTGGLLSAALTSLPGSSGYFKLGLVTYGNSAKAKLLGIPAGKIKKEGAVSVYTAKAMAKAARRLSSSRISAAITGIAGPSGGRPGKPVGTVFIAVSSERKTLCRGFLFPGPRSSVRKQAVEKAVDMLLEALLTRESGCARS